MGRAAYAYVVATVVLSVLFAALLPWGPVYALGLEDLGALGLFVGLAVLSNAIGFEFTVAGQNKVRSSIHFIPLLAAAIVFPPAAAFLAGAATELLSALQRPIKKLWRESFNSAQIGLALGLASLTFSAISGLGGIERGQDTANSWYFMGFVGLVVVYFGTNLIVVGGFFSIKQQEPFARILKKAVGPGGGNLLYDVLASPVALVAAILFEDLGYGGVLIVVLPLLLIRYSYLSQVQLQQANRDLLKVLIKAIETRDPYTSGHSMRVSTLAKAIAQDLGLGSKLEEKIETAALLHDIGKIESLYSEIIGKQATLTDEERAVIKTHATKGAELLKNLTSFEAPVVAGVRHHHERFDGSGYPGGLAADEIPIAARIIMMCDAIDAMLSDRPYRSALPLAEVKAELLRCSGTQFDPSIVQIVLDKGTLERAAALVLEQGANAQRKVAAQTA